jgi:Zn-dependent protease
VFIYYSHLLKIGFSVFLAFAGAVTLALVLGIAFHEFCHALSAYLLGDDTAKRRGRLTLNPLAHLDPFGTILLVVAGFGWGKPTPVNPYNMRIEPRAGMAITAAAGPLSNLLVAAVLAIPIRAGWATWHDPFLTNFRISGWHFSDYFGLFLGAAIWINCILAVFNFLPLAPLDGFRIWTGILPIEIARPLMRLEPYGMFILMGLFLLGPAIGINIFGGIVQPVGERITGTLTGVHY